MDEQTLHLTFICSGRAFLQHKNLTRGDPARVEEEGIYYNTPNHSLREMEGGYGKVKPPAS